MSKRTYIEPLGTSGLKQMDGVIDEEWSKKLRGDWGIKVFREMVDSSATIGAVKFAITSLMSQVEWRVEPASADEPAIEAAEFIEGALEDMDHTLEALLIEILTFLDYGWAFFEIVYKIRRGQTKNRQTRSKFEDGMWGWRSIALRGQDTLDRWQYDEKERSLLLGMWQADYNFEVNSEVFLPFELDGVQKGVLFRTMATKNNPQGRSIYRNAVNAYFFLKRISMIEAIGIERDLAGMPVMEVPLDLLSSDASTEEKALLAEFKTLMARIKVDEQGYAIIPNELNTEGKPTGYKFKLMASGGTKQIDTGATKTYYKNDILQSVMAQFIALGSQSVGSFALSSSQTELFGAAMGGIMDNITATFNTQLIAPLCRLNEIPQEYFPKLVHGDIETPNLAELGAYLQALASSNLLPTHDGALQRKVLEVAGLPLPEEGADEDMDDFVEPTEPTPVQAPAGEEEVPTGDDLEGGQ